MTEKDFENLVLHIIQTHKMVKENNQMLRDIELILNKFARNIKMENGSQSLDG